MGHTLKKTLHQKIRVDRVSIHFQSILATPTKTVIKGSIQNILELARDQLTGERLRPMGINMELIADGKPMLRQAGGMTTDMNGITFSTEYDPLPSGIKQLQIKFVSFSADHDVHEKIGIQAGMPDRLVRVGKQDIMINEVYESQGDTFVTITTEENVVLTRVNLLTDDTGKKLQETISDEHAKTAEGAVTHTRTLHFKGVGKELKLVIERMTYTEVYDKSIDVPVD
jgi:hypothetical protein